MDNDRQPKLDGQRQEPGTRLGQPSTPDSRRSTAAAKEAPEPLKHAGAAAAHGASGPRTPESRDARVEPLKPDSAPQAKPSPSAGSPGHAPYEPAPPTALSRRLPTCPIIVTTDTAEQEARVLPQPPGNPRTPESPRARALSTRAFSQRSLASASSVPTSPGMASMGHDAMATSATGSEPLTKVQVAQAAQGVPAGLSPRRSAPSGATPAQQRAVAALTAASDSGGVTSGRAPASPATDPWAGLQAHCFAAYGGNLDSSDEDGGSSRYGPATAGPPRHQAPSRGRSLSGAFAAAAAEEPTGPPAPRAFRRQTSISAGGGTPGTGATAAAPEDGALLPVRHFKPTSGPTASLSDSGTPPLLRTPSFTSTRTAQQAAPGNSAAAANPHELLLQADSVASSVLAPMESAGGSSFPGFSGSSGFSGLSGPSGSVGSRASSISRFSVTSAQAPLLSTHSSGSTAGTGPDTQPQQPPYPSLQQARAVSPVAALFRPEGIAALYGPPGAGAVAVSAGHLAAEWDASAAVPGAGPGPPSGSHLLAGALSLAHGLGALPGPDKASDGAQPNGTPDEGAVGSILDSAPVSRRAESFRRLRRLSSDGLARHASRYAGSGETPSGPGGGDGGGFWVSEPAGGGRDVGPEEGGRSPGAAPLPSPAASSTLASWPASPAGTGAGAASPVPPSPGRAPLITALALEKAPWAAPPPAAPPSPGAQLPSKSFRLRSPAHSLSGTAPLTLALPPHAASPPRLSPDAFPARPHELSPSPEQSPSDALDRLRGFRSYRALPGERATPSMAPCGTAANNAVPAGGLQLQIRPTAAMPSGAAAPAAAAFAAAPLTRMSSSKSVQAASMRASVSFLDRLSSSGAGGSAGGGRSGGGREAMLRSGGSFRSLHGERRSASGGSGGGGSFRRRGSARTSADGVGWGDAGEFVIEGDEEEGDDGSMGRGEARPQRMGRCSDSGAALTMRSCKELLPRGPNGLPLAWTSIPEAEDGAGGDSGGGGQAGEAGGPQRQQEDGEEGFDPRRCYDLNMTC